MSVTDVEYRPGVPLQARRLGPATRCPPPPAVAAAVNPMLELAEDVTCLVHAGRPRSAGVLLAELDPAALHELVLALAATRRPQWVREGDGVDEVLVERAINGAPVRLTMPERTAAAQAIIRRGGSTTELAKLLHLNGAAARALYESVAAILVEDKRVAARAIIRRGGGTAELSAGLHVSAPVAAILYETITGQAATWDRQQAVARAILRQGGTATDVAVVLDVSSADARTLCAAAGGARSARGNRRPMRRLPTGRDAR